MRQLKFRAWDGEKMISPDYISRDGLAYWRENSVIETSDKVMLWSGLTDKNGTEIYSGDLVVSDFGTKLPCEVLYGEYHDAFFEDKSTSVGFYFSEQDGDKTAFGKSINGDTNQYEVIGNIYQS